MTTESRKRMTMISREKAEAHDRTNSLAREMIARERERRDAKTRRLKEARLQAEEQGRQL